MHFIYCSTTNFSYQFGRWAKNDFSVRLRRKCTTNAFNNINNNNNNILITDDAGIILLFLIFPLLLFLLCDSFFINDALCVLPEEARAHSHAAKYTHNQCVYREEAHYTRTHRGYRIQFVVCSLLLLLFNCTHHMIFFH